MISDVSICNTALDRLGADPILSLDDDSKSGRLCKRNYDLAFEQVLQSYPWNGAIARATLPALSVEPAWGFAYQYALPEGADPPRCLRVLAVAGEIEGTASPYRIEGRNILSDDGPALKIVYIARPQNPALLGPTIADLIALRLAGLIAFTLTGSVALADSVGQSYRHAMAAAKMYDAQEGTPEAFTASQLLEARL